MDPLPSKIGENYFFKQPFKVSGYYPKSIQKISIKNLLKLSKKIKSLQYLRNQDSLLLSSLLAYNKIETSLQTGTAKNKAPSPHSS